MITVLPEADLFHPVCDVFPPMTDDEYRALVEDIREHGQREPIVRYEGQIIDGKHRWRACRLLEIEPRFREFEGPGSPVAYAVSVNLHRRHLNAGQKAMVGESTLALFEAEANKRQLAQLKQNRPATDNSVPANLPERTEEKGEAREKAAAVVGVSPRSIQTAKKVRKERPDLAKKVEQGQMTLNRAAKEAKKSEAPEPRADPALAAEQARLKLMIAFRGDLRTVRRVFEKHDPEQIAAAATDGDVSGCQELATVATEWLERFELARPTALRVVGGHEQ